MVNFGLIFVSQADISPIHSPEHDPIALPLEDSSTIKSESADEVGRSSVLFQNGRTMSSSVVNNLNSSYTDHLHTDDGMYLDKGLPFQANYAHKSDKTHGDMAENRRDHTNLIQAEMERRYAVVSKITTELCEKQDQLHAQTSECSTIQLSVNQLTVQLEQQRMKLHSKELEKQSISAHISILVNSLRMEKQELDRLLSLSKKQHFSSMDRLDKFSETSVPHVIASATTKSNHLKDLIVKQPLIPKIEVVERKSKEVRSSNQEPDNLKPYSKSGRECENGKPSASPDEKNEKESSQVGS
ncbi:hypothetical protein BJ742DRAFT_204083 [Cladochytrium replicatum]|nr:hypothetical protein BJ742DRAFT_204083 [Cladochytrium replicatum]